MLLKENLKNLFQGDYDRECWLSALTEIFPTPNTVFAMAKPIKVARIPAVQKFWQIGEIYLASGMKIAIFEVHVKENTQLHRNRAQLRNCVAGNMGIYSGALAIFCDDKQWRFSFVSTKKYDLDQDGNLIETHTAPKRYTYLLGKGKNVRTAVNRFCALAEKNTLEGTLLDEVYAAFAVEPLNREFYKKLYDWYETAKKSVIFPNDEHVNDHTSIALIRMLTRLLFVWFIKEKGLVSPILFDEEKVQNLIDWSKPSGYYKAILQNLFFATLNRKINDRSFRSTTTSGEPNGTNYLVSNIFRYKEYFLESDEAKIQNIFAKTPFLNGGLFECLDRNASEKEKAAYQKKSSTRETKSAIRIDGFSDRPGNPLCVPNELFFSGNEKTPGLIDILLQYQFTLEESSAMDEQVALDPELLGKVFENLLASYNPETEEAAQKESGSYYTPRKIVSYMVDESLKAHFLRALTSSDEISTERQRKLIKPAKGQSQLTATRGTPALIKKKLLALFQGDTKQLTPSEIHMLVGAINKITILDPAVGSGAFAMGALHRLTELLAVLDPNNKMWKMQQLQRLEDPESIEAVEELFSAENQYNDYSRKLYLIENAIFGVDIQPIAVQICKLRFFISLVIEQTPTGARSKNYGIKALPNLETKFVSADSLIELKQPPRGKSYSLESEGVKNIMTELAKIRSAMFNAKTTNRKTQLRSKDGELRTDLLVALNQAGWEEESAMKIASWVPYTQSHSANWFDAKWMFGVNDGFDIVIGNPPYIQLENNEGKLAKRYQGQNYQSFARRGDIYCLFYERGLQLAGVDAVLCYITSNKWMRAGYGAKLRAHFATTTNPLQLLDFGGLKIFENATVDTNILLVQQAAPKQQMQAVQFKADYQRGDAISVYVDEHAAPLPVTAESWFIASPVVQTLREKIEQQGVPLAQWDDVQISYGIKTGYNEAFIIDEARRQILLNACQDKKERKRTDALLRPILRGRNIHRYHAEWAGLYVILAKFGIHKTLRADNPAIYAYLKQHEQQLKARGQCRYSRNQQQSQKISYPGQHHWLELDNNPQDGYITLFEKEKIVWSDISIQPTFHLLKDAIFFNNTAYMIVGSHLAYMVGVLNSSVVKFYFPMIASDLGAHGNRYFKQFVARLPIPSVTPKNRPLVSKIESLVETITAAKKSDTTANTSAQEAEIDTFVYKLYGITKAEQKTIEGE